MSAVTRLVLQDDVAHKGFVANGEVLDGGSGYFVAVMDGENDLGILAMAFEKKPRHFKSLDAIKSTAEKLGFKSVTVNLN
ncbi:hypothetical protein [Pseudoalteromonas luteoviolacea]|uniref:Uncharacterized protein n=1 Tax=Pseudoalteromonas luteoviolacea S4060-1 TaxID=1365257 RepID=A0A167KVM9_9GAMM|nr:hypothetical protein [Pseudoalteromonas luteoviolacea]KZN63358.1 hypothetical protein N478_03655 [Pseudoalteromonas luteoviolacea S4060-1]